MAFLVGIGVFNYERTLFGVFVLENLDPTLPITGELDDVFWCPQSLHAGLADDAMISARDSGILKLLAYGKAPGYTIFSTSDDRFFAHTGHPEYNATPLAFVAKRDLDTPEFKPPENFDFDNPLIGWRSHRNNISIPS
jgi:Homoserine trans-succinylase